MSVQFVLGRAGAGKTRHLLNSMIELMRTDPLGPPIYWLLPRQATFQAERLLTAQLGGFSRIHVVSFDLLGKELLTHCGDVGIPEVTAIGRRMVIGHLLRLNKPRLKFYSSSAHRRGLAAELDSVFGEFERAGLDVPALADLLAKPQEDSALNDKLLDLHLLLDAYNTYIGQDTLDPQRRLWLILKRVADCSLLKDAHLFVDDFFDFTAHERKLLTAIAGQVKQTVISLLIDPDSDAVRNPAALLSDLSVFHRTERTYRSLLGAMGVAGLTVERPIVLHGTHRATSPDLLAIEQHLFSAERLADPVTSVQAIEAPDARAEVDAVARCIQTAVANGTRYRQISVLVRDLSEYQELIDASFGEHGLPCFSDRRRTAGHHPLLRMARAALQIAERGWPHEAVMALVKTGLVGLDDDQADQLENYVLKHRIRGRMWESDQTWKFSRELLLEEGEQPGEPVLEEGNPVDIARRSLHEKLTPLLQIAGTTVSVRDWATQLLAVLDAFGVRRKLREWMDRDEQANDLERRDEHEQVWSEFVKLFDHMVALLGNEPITLVDFIDVLDSGLESFDLALTPVRVDQILVGQIDRTRPPELKIVFVLGMNQGSFPQLQKERCVISDRERRMLRQRNIDLDPDSQRRLLDERFLGYLAFTRPSAKLILTRHTADDAGRAVSPSSFWFELQRLLPALPIQSISRASSSDPKTIGTPRQLVTSLMHWVRNGAGGDGSDPVPAALYQWLFTAPLSADMQAMRDHTWHALRYSNAASLSGELAAALFPPPMELNARQLETAAQCPFRHFARYGLTLRDRDEPDVTGLDLSNAYHEILENLVKDCLETKQDWCGLKSPEAREMIRTHAADIGRRLRGELMLSTARNRYLLDRIERNLEQVVAAMLEMHRRGRYRPGFAALRFGTGAALPPQVVRTPSGQAVHLRGQIDRVDLNHQKSAFVVADYRMGAGPLQLDRVYHGLSLQLLTSLLVIQSNGPQLAGRKLAPAAAFLLQLLRSPQQVDHPSEAKIPEDPNFHLRVKPRGLVEFRAIKSIDTHLTEGYSDVISVYLNKTDGEAGRRNATDAADPKAFEGLIHHVEKRIGELADQISTGEVSVAPFMINRQTPCSHCEFRSVCRFEPGINRYRILPPMKREEVLTAVVGG